MEILLAIVVVSAVIFFGALISMGNERQRKALDTLREQVVMWAVRDLQIKREKLARDVRVDNPLEWFMNVIACTCNLEGDLRLVDVFDNPKAMAFTYPGNGKNIIVTPVPPGKIRELVDEKRNRISKSANGNPFFALPRKVSGKEISVMNGGLLFDLELPIAWKALTGQDVLHVDQLWVYELPW